jgi:hypothetical protein
MGGRGIIAALLATALAQCAATSLHPLERGMFAWASAEVRGSRPLLVLWVREGEALAEVEIGKYRQYYEDVVFGTPDKRAREEDNRFELSVVDYFREVSEGRFTFARAGLAGPLSAAHKGKRGAEMARLALEAAAREGGVDFSRFDGNGDRRLASDELAVLLIASAPPPGRPTVIDAAAAGAEIAIPGQNIAFAGRIAVVGERDNFAVFNRALFRLVAPEAVDLDGFPERCFALNGGRTLMAALNTADPGLTMHLDPWHKMLVGWLEPRVFAIGKPYSAKLAAQHISGRSAAEEKRPILLYDAMKGPGEFFLLEYRTHSMLGFDQVMVNSGLVVWQVALANNRPFKVPADRKNCRGETLPVPSLAVRGAPNWQLGGSTAYWGGDGPLSLRWMDGTDSGVRVSIERHEPVDWHIAVTWTSVTTPAAQKK